MIKTCNPGRVLVVVGDFELVGQAEQFTMDRESMLLVELADLLAEFRNDPNEPYIGRLRITVEPANDPRPPCPPVSASATSQAG